MKLEPSKVLGPNGEPAAMMLTPDEPLPGELLVAEAFARPRFPRLAAAGLTLRIWWASLVEFVLFVRVFPVWRRSRLLYLSEVPNRPLGLAIGGVRVVLHEGERVEVRVYGRAVPTIVPFVPESRPLPDPETPAPQES